MSKIYIVGVVASGKTTMAKMLSEKLNIPWYELDSVVHVHTENGYYRRTPDEQIQEINRINTTGSWICEGVYRETHKCVLDLADEIIFLDPPLWIRKKRIFTRFIKQKLRIESCLYKPRIDMLKKMFEWTNDFENNRQKFENVLRAYENKLIRISKISDYTKQK